MLRAELGSARTVWRTTRQVVIPYHDGAIAMVDDRDVQLTAGCFHYRDWGGSGASVVLLHGAGFTSHQWNFVAPLLASRFRVYALDLRGHGESTKPNNGYDVDSNVEDVRAFVEAVAQAHPILVGHSWGGTIALRYAACDPKRCVAIVLVDGGFFRPSSLQTWEETEKSLGPSLDGVRVDLFLAGARALPDYAARWSSELEQVLLANHFVLEDGTIRPRLRREHQRAIARSNYEHDPSELYERVGCPVLLIPAMGKPRNEREETWIAHRRDCLAIARQRLVGAQALCIESSHNIPLVRPNELAAAIHKFVDEIPLGPVR